MSHYLRSVGMFALILCPEVVSPNDRLNQGPSTERLQKDLLPLPAWIPSAADIVEQSETPVTVIEARSRNAWLLLCIACINSHCSGGRSGSELLVCVGPPSPAQLSSRRAVRCSGPSRCRCGMPLSKKCGAAVARAALQSLSLELFLWQRD